MRRAYLDKHNIVTLNKQLSRFDRRRLNWFIQRMRDGVASIETWNVDSTMVELLLERLEAYNDYTIVDTTYHTVEFEGETMTEQQCIDTLIEWCVLYLSDDEEKIEMDAELHSRIWTLWGKIGPMAWW